MKKTFSMKKPFHKSSTPQLDTDTASRILERTFEAVDAEPNSVPLDDLISNVLYHKRRRIWQKAAFAGAIVLVFVLIFLYLLSIPASFTIHNRMREEEFNPVYDINVDAPMLVKRVNVTIDGRPVPLYETASHVYTTEPSLNGQMEVTVTLFNGRSAAQSVDVTAVDRENPAVLSCTREGNQVYLYLADDFSGIDYDSLQAIGLSGKAITPVSVEPSSGCVILPCVDETINFYVADLAGNRLQLVITIQ